MSWVSRRARCSSDSCVSAVQALLHGPSQGQDSVSTRQQLGLGLAYQCHKHFPHPPALSAETAHNLLEVVLELVGLHLQLCTLCGALGGYGRDELEDFFWALYSVAASLTRWLPCSLGKVSTTRCAGLTSPSSMAARRLDREQFLHQRRIETAAKLGEHFGQHKMLLGAIHLDLPDPTGIHHRQVGPQPATDLFVGTGQLMFQEFQRQ